MIETKYGNTAKKICFQSTDKLHAELKIRLNYDEIKVCDFFNEMVAGYINKNKYVLAFIEELKEKKQISKIKRKKIIKAQQEEKKIIDQFGINKNDIENIFDILEKEHPDL